MNPIRLLRPLHDNELPLWLRFDPGPRRLNRFVQLGVHDLWRGQNRQVFRNVNSSRAEFQQLYLLCVLSRAEDDAERRTFSRFDLMLGQPSQVQLHLAFVFRLEPSLLQFNHHQSLQSAVVKQQVYVEVIAVHLDALLPRDERKARSQLQQERLQFAQVASSRSRSKKRSVKPRKSSTYGSFSSKDGATSP